MEGDNMDTLQQALFRAMLIDEWFAQSSGDTESPVGYFGWVANHSGEWGDVADAFDDVIREYGAGDLSEDSEWVREHFLGTWYASINSDGIIRIEKLGGADAARRAKERFNRDQRDYIDWSNSQDD